LAVYLQNGAFPSFYPNSSPVYDGLNLFRGLFLDGAFLSVVSQSDVPMVTYGDGWQ
jgi:hypothetical protein